MNTQKFSHSNMSPSRDRMRIVTLNLPVAYLKVVEKMELAGLVPSRSHAVREALNQFLLKEAVFYQQLNDQEIEFQ